MAGPDVMRARPKPAPKKKRKYGWLLWLVFALFAFSSMALIGSASGYQAAQQSWSSTQAAYGVQSLAEQFALGVEDLSSGQYDLARQRFEYILAREPAFPGAADKLAEVMSVQFATATPSPIPPTQTPTPTRDLRPVEDLYSNIISKFAAGDWDGTIDGILALRKTDPDFRVVAVDGMLYRSLRSRGIRKIKEESNLEGGIYDLALAERIGPLDAEAITYRDLARYYMMGSGFWEVYPEQAVYYFGMVASAAPYLRDASGWTASARFQAALVQYADQLARDGDWCSAQEQYELAISYGGVAGLQATAVYAAEKCAPPTETASPTETPEQTITPSPTLVIVVTATPSLTPVVSPTATQPAAPTATIPATAQPTTAPTQEITPTGTPSDTPPPSPTSIPTEAPTETSTPEQLPTQTSAPTTMPSEIPEASPTSTVQSIQLSPMP